MTVLTSFFCTENVSCCK